MTRSLPDYLAALNKGASGLTFADTLAVIDAHYDFTPTGFHNGGVDNPAGSNNGSCKVFSFARLQNLTAPQTLLMFAEHYQNVLNDPGGDAHANIRAFMKTGFDGLKFEGAALSLRA